MEYKESLEIVLRDCRFILSAADLHRLLPGVEDFVPPLTAIRFSDQAAPRFTWGFPVVHGRRLLWVLHQFLTKEIARCLASPSYQENLRQITPAELKEDVYFQTLSDFLLKTLSEGSFLRLDSVLWIYLSDLVCRRLNQDEPTDRLLRALCPNEYAKLRSLDPEMTRIRYKDPKRFADIRNKVLRSLFARNDFANSCMKDVFDEVPNNPLNREMIANRLIYTERGDSFYRGLDLTEAFLIKGYKFAATDFAGINRVLRIVISGMMTRAGTDKVLPHDTYFLKTFLTDEVRQKAATIPSQGIGLEKASAGSTREAAELEEREKIAYLLALQEEPTRYLLWHLEEKDYYKPAERHGTIPREILKALRYRASAVVLEGLYTEVVRDLLRWDFFHALQNRLRWVMRRGETYYSDERPLTRATIPLNLDSFYEIFRRSRYGTAVFFDLVGFTDRTKALTRELQEAAARGDKERYDLSSVSLAIQRVFAVRNNLDHFGGIPQGFEGDAILDMFPRALDALRYVTSFAENYTKNRHIRFRPFERPTENPYRDGFRVGMASGDYSLISIVGRSNELVGVRSTDRAVGHTINRASRLNSGKRGEKYLLLGEEAESQNEAKDPFNLFRVRVTSRKELNNNGIASFEDTFLELRTQVRSEEMHWFEPPTNHGGKVAGVMPRLRNYAFELIFEDPRTRKVYCVRKLARRPELKGLEDEQVTIYEYLIFEAEEFKEFILRDAEHVPTVASIQASALPLLNIAAEGVDAMESPLVTQSSAFDWEAMVDEDAAELQTRLGLAMSDISQGEDAVRSAISRHESGFVNWAEHHQAAPEETPPWEVEIAHRLAPTLQLDAPAEEEEGDEPVLLALEGLSLELSSQPGARPPGEWEAEPIESVSQAGPAPDFDWSRPVEPYESPDEAVGAARPELSDASTAEPEFSFQTFELPVSPHGGPPWLELLKSLTASEEELPELGLKEAELEPETPFEVEDLPFLGHTDHGATSDLEDEASGPGLEEAETAPQTPPDAPELPFLGHAAGGAAPELPFLGHAARGPASDLDLADAPTEHEFFLEVEDEDEERPIERRNKGDTSVSATTGDLEHSDFRDDDSLTGYSLNRRSSGFAGRIDVSGPSVARAPLGEAPPEPAQPGRPDWDEVIEPEHLHVTSPEPSAATGEDAGEAATEAAWYELERSAKAEEAGSSPLDLSALREEGNDSWLSHRLSQLGDGSPATGKISARFHGYVFSVAQLGLTSESTRMLIARVSGDLFEDVHIYPMQGLQDEQEELDAVFLQFLEDKEREAFAVSPATWVIAEPFASKRRPLPIAHLERLYQQKRAR